jgi:nucleoside-diphosphate-sugar epimerase
MRVLVVGGGRFVGLEIVNRLVLDRHDVTLLSLDAPPPALAPHLRHVRADRNHRDELGAALASERFDSVVDNIAYEPAQVALVLDVLRGRLSRYVLTSSVDVYGLHFPHGRREDQAPCEPVQLDGISGHERYARGKRACERVLAEAGVQWTVLRPSMVTGVRDNITPPPVLRHLGPGEDASRSHFFAARVLDGGPVLLRDDDHAVFRLAWAPDVGRAASFVLSRADAANRAFNVAGDEVWTHERLVRALAMAAGREVELVWVSAAELEAAALSDYDPPYGRGPYWSVAEPHALQAIGFRPTRA